MSVRISPLRRVDIARCVELERQLFPGEDPWTARIFASELAHGNHYFGAYAQDGTLIGYAGLSVNGRAPDFETSVHTLAVDPAWQGNGIGRTLLRILLDVADEVNAPVFLEVRTDNTAALGLYEAHGFCRLGLRRGYYQPSGADAYTMGRPASATVAETEDGGEPEARITR